MMQKVALLFMALVVGVLVAGCGGGLQGDIPIGTVLSLTGAGGSAYAGPQQQGVQLAVDEINDSKLLGKAKLKLVVKDDGSTPEGAKAAFLSLINQDKVIAILGPTLSGSAKASDPIAQNARVVVLGVSNTASGITEMGDFVFRDSLPESVVQPHTVKAAKERLGIKRVAIIYTDGDVFSISSQDAFKTAFLDEGVEVVAVRSIPEGAADIRRQLDDIKAMNVDAIVITSLVEDVVQVMKQARQIGIPDRVVFIGGNNFNTPRLAELAGPVAEGAISGAAWHAGEATPGNQAFVLAYRQRYGEDPDQFAAQAYTGVYLLAKAIKDAKSTDTTKVRDALAAIRDMDTILGRFSFSAGREPLHTPVVQIIRNGKVEVFK